ncbi:MAG TPA: PAS domain-containing protein [Alphaproteobacteria bacterium]|nr:PAS domain-containing protein [Alphaproteobacteria bacterium]
MERLKQVADALPVLIAFVDEDQRYRFVNKCYEDWFGHPREAIVGRHLREVLGEDAYAAIQPHVEAVLTGGRPHFEALLPYKDAGPRHVSVQYIPNTATDGTVSGFYVFVEDISERQWAEQSLRESEALYRTLAEATPDLVWIAAANGKVQFVNSRWTAYTGLTLDQFNASGWEALYHPDDRAQLADRWATAAKAEVPFEAEFRCRRRDGAYRWFWGRAVPLKDSSGRLVKWIGTSTDITERKGAEERQRLLTREIDHRAKNLLTVVLSILRLTRAKDVESFVAKVESRVMALAQAHSLLAEGRWHSADLSRLLEEVLAPYRMGVGGISISGPPTSLTTIASQSLALALHELATNAAKYGALSDPKGRLAVTWRIVDEGLILTWTECGGPAMAGAPERYGFGITVVTTSVEQQLKGRVSFEWRQEGLRATLRIPSAYLAGTEAALLTDAASQPKIQHSADAIAELTGRRILVVEDEPLIAMVIEDALADAGCSVIGPASTLPEALALADSEKLDAAVLDRNLGGVSTAPLAMLLRERGIAFGVVTGYTESDLQAEFVDAPRLAKPFEPGALITLLSRVVISQSTPAL